MNVLHPTKIVNVWSVRGGESVMHVTERVQVLPQLVSKISTLYADRRLRFRGL